MYIYIYVYMPCSWFVVNESGSKSLRFVVSSLSSLTNTLPSISLSRIDHGDLAKSIGTTLRHLLPATPGFQLLQGCHSDSNNL